MGSFLVRDLFAGKADIAALSRVVSLSGGVSVTAMELSVNR